MGPCGHIYQNPALAKGGHEFKSMGKNHKLRVKQENSTFKRSWLLLSSIDHSILVAWGRVWADF